MPRIYLLYVFLFSAGIAFAQPLSAQDTAQLFYRHFTVQDGLPSNEVYTAHQDKKGYIWFSTDNGVSRFDGVQFKNYTASEGLRSNVISGCQEDPQGNLWAYSFSGELYRYHPATDRFDSQSFNDSLLRLLAGRTIQNLVFEKDTLYVVSTGAYIKLVFRADAKPLLQLVEGEAMTLSVKMLANGQLVVINSTEENVTRFNFELHGPGFRKVQRIYNIPIYGLVQQQLSALTSGNDLYVVFGENLLVYTLNTGEHRMEVLPFSHIPALKKTSAGILSGSYGRGLWCLAKAGDQLSYRQLIKTKNVSDCFEDKQGGIWACSQTDGVYFIPNRTSLSFVQSNSEASRRVTDLFTSGNTAFYMTYSGALYKVEAEHVPVQKRLIEPGEYNMRTMKALNTNEILLFAGRTLNYTISSGKVGGISSREICERRSGIEQPQVIARRDKLFARACEGAAYPERLISEHWNFGEVFSSFQQPDGAMWLATINDLVYRNAHTHALSVVGRASGLRKFSVKHILALGTDSVLVASNQGIFLVVKDEVRKRISSEDGLSSDNVQTLFLNDGYLWSGTSCGIDRIINYASAEKPVVVSVTGLTGIARCPVTHLGVIGNYLIAGTDEGVYLFSRKDIFRQPVEVVPQVTELIVNGTQRLFDFNEGVDLGYTENSLHIRFNALNYRNSLYNKYRYRFKKNETTEWLSTALNQVSVPAMSPGTYEFELQAMNPDGSWSKETRRFALTIAKPFWQTWWFILLMIAAAGSTAYGLFLFRIKQMEKVGDLTSKLSEAKMQALGMQLNPHFVFNALNSVSSHMAKNDAKSTLKILGKFAKLMRLVFKNSQHAVIPLEDELNALNLYIELETIRLGKTFISEIDIDAINVADCKVPALLLQPFVENAIWHGIGPLDAGGKLQLIFMRVGDTLQVEIIDNGVGRRQARINRPKEDRRRHSLDIIKERLMLLRTKYNCYTHIELSDAFEGTECCGTKVLLIIPWLSDTEVRGKDKLLKHFTLDDQSAYN